MKILYVSQYFPPEMGAPAARVSELSRLWVRQGHKVAVLTAFPNHPTGVIPPEYRRQFRRLVSKENVDGIDVVRTWLLPLPNGRPWQRLLNYLSFLVSSCITGSFLERPDVIIATTPQLFVGLSGLWLGWLKSVPLILEVRDIWPDSITASGVGGRMASVLRLVSKFLFRAYEHIVVVSPAFKDELISRWNVPEGKLSLVQNGVDTELFSPDGHRTGNGPKTTGPKFTVSYIGTFGAAQGLGLVLEAAALLRGSLSGIQFQLIGEGAEKEKILRLAEERHLDNVHILSQQPREKIPSLIRGSDVCLVLLKKADIFKTVIPTKLLEFMACGRPVILGVEGLARQIVESANAGIAIEPENPGALADAITRLYRSPDLARSLAQNGPRYIAREFSRNRTAELYLDVLGRILANADRKKSECELGATK